VIRERFSTEKPHPKKQNIQKSKAPAFFAEAFDWDGMGGNIGGLSVYVLALVIMYSTLVE